MSKTLAIKSQSLELKSKADIPPKRILRQSKKTSERWWKDHKKLRWKVFYPKNKRAVQYQPKAVQIDCLLLDSASFWRF